MIRLLYVIVAVLALAGPPAARAGQSDAVPGEMAPPPSSPDLGDFEKRLSPHGEWIESPGYGPVWRPRVSARWRPYHDGQWRWTAQGWYWDSHEPWAWATYHYGRWAWDPSLGWLWVPGYAWAPAWVSWRVGAGVVGWAPLTLGFAHPSFFFAWTFVPAVKFVGFPVVRVAIAPVFVRKVFFSTHPVSPRRIFHGIAPHRRSWAPHRQAPTASGFHGGFAPAPRFQHGSRGTLAQAPRFQQGVRGSLAQAPRFMGGARPGPATPRGDAARGFRSRHR